MSSKTSTIATSPPDSSKIISAKADKVPVKSVLETETRSKVSIENEKKIADLLARLKSTHLKVDEYSRKRTEDTRDDAVELIKKVVEDTKVQQKQLVADANLRTTEIENDFKRKLREHLSKLDVEKAAVLAQLEKELHGRQELILETARKRIDDLDEESRRSKSGLLKDAKGKSSAEVKKITEKADLRKEDASRRLQSTTKTVIKTKADEDDDDDDDDDDKTDDKDRDDKDRDDKDRDDEDRDDKTDDKDRKVKVGKTTKKVESSKSPSAEYRRD